MKMKLSEIIRAVDGSFGYPADTEITSVSTDTRSIKDNSVFIALKGENFDGHDFGAKAQELGAKAVIAERAIPGAKCIIVDSTARALLQLASYYRRKFPVPLVGITGSVGKTTTKDMTALVLSEKYNTLRTEGNHNNEIGMPLTLFEMDENTEAAVIEMGMNHAGEISRLSMCCEPTIAAITGIGYSHIENLGSQEAILKAKLEILDGAQYLAPLVLSMDDKLLSQIEPRHGRKIIFHSIRKKTADVYASDISSDGKSTFFNVNFNKEKIPVKLQLLGEHNIKNALSAFCIGLELGVDPEKISQALGRFIPQGIRQNVRSANGMTFIVDCYNAAPDSIKAALSVLSQTVCPDGGKRIAVLSDMKELGKRSRSLHRLVGEYVAASGAQLLYCCGEDSKFYAEGAIKKGMPEDSCFYFESKERMTQALKSSLKPGDAVLFKASRAMKLEETVNALE